MKYSLILGSLFLFCLFPLSLFAAPVIRTGDQVSLKEDQGVTGDFYAVGRSVSNSSQMDADAYIIAASIVQNGEVAADLLMIAATAQVLGPVGDDVRIVAGNAVVSDHVAGDVVVVGGELTILSTAEIDGDVIFYGGSLDLAGKVGGSVFARAEDVRIDGTVGKDIDAVGARSVTLGAHADVAGDVVYESHAEIVRALDANVGGTVTRNETGALDEPSSAPSILPLVVLLFSGFAARFVFGAHLATLLTRTQNSFGMSALVGFAAFILAPVALALAFASMVGAAIGLVLLLAYLFAVIVAILLSGVFVGGAISHYATGATSYSIFWMTIGTLVLYALSMLPYIGLLATLLIILMVLGGMIIKLYELIK